MRHNGFTLVEVIMVVAIVGLLAVIAYPSFERSVEKGRVANSAADLSEMAQAIERFFIANNRYPDSLADIGSGAKLDPWDMPYSYLKIMGNPRSGRRQRRDLALQPINSDFDLYSWGKDKFTDQNISNFLGQDDVIRGRNGRYIGLGEKF
jgi:general secretion pathway protein G